MKKVYLIRHGQSQGNVGLIREMAGSPLTATGKKQATILAKHCLQIPLEVIISSPLIRAKETAEIIAEEIKKPLELNELFSEWRRPSQQLGRPKNDAKAMEAEKTIRANFSIDGFRFSDEENFNELKTRALAALAFLEKRPENNILAVTHEFFMRIILAAVVFGDRLTGVECRQFIRSFHIKNAAITVLGLDQEKYGPGWWVWVWNDHSHQMK